MTSAPPGTAPRVHPVPIAPALKGKPTPPSENEQTMNFTCATCSRRKVKCDKVGPTCATCRRAKLECVWQEPAPRKRKRKTVDDVHERLEYYEKLLKDNGIFPANADGSLPSPSATPNHGNSILDYKPPTSMGPDKHGKLVAGEGKSRYIDSNIWRHLGDDDLNPSSDEEEDDHHLDSTPATWTSPGALTDPVSAAMLSIGSPSQNLVDLHPPYDTAIQLWKLYTENIDPIVKIVHVPSFQPILQRGAANPSSVPRATEALMFAIYHFAASSISDEQCHKMFKQPQIEMVDRLHAAARQALVNAHFMRTTELMVLQAYLLFLLAVRMSYDSPTFWILTGIAVRIAERIGIHRDGEALGLKPFDVQMRRRFFWQLLPLDGLSGQICGTGIAMDAKTWDTKQPLNLNDHDIWPDMEEKPKEREGATDMIFCLARSEIGKFHQKTFAVLGSWSRFWNSADVPETEKMLKFFEDEIELKYLRYCEFVNPLHNLTQAMARGAITAGRLRVRLGHAREVKNISDNEREEIWELARKIIDYTLAVNTNPMFFRFKWHMRSFFPWDALVWMLNECQRDPSGGHNDEIWLKIQEVYDVYPDIVTSKRALHMAIGTLTLRRWDTYINSPATPGHPKRAEPNYIPLLREKSEKRANSRSNTGTAPQPPYNPFDPALNNGEDWAIPVPIPTTQSTGDIAFNTIPDIDFNTNDMDWTFWDNIVNQNSVPFQPYNAELSGSNPYWAN